MMVVILVVIFLTVSYVSLSLPTKDVGKGEILLCAVIYMKSDSTASYAFKELLNHSSLENVIPTLSIFSIMCSSCMN